MIEKKSNDFSSVMMFNISVYLSPSYLTFEFFSLTMIVLHWTIQEWNEISSWWNQMFSSIYINDYYYSEIEWIAKYWFWWLFRNIFPVHVVYQQSLSKEKNSRLKSDKKGLSWWLTLPVISVVVQDSTTDSFIMIDFRIELWEEIYSIRTCSITHIVGEV